MRSELIFSAMTNVSNRFLLTRIASKATRKFHRPNTRIQETANTVFERISLANPISRVPHTATCIRSPALCTVRLVHWVKI